MDTLSSEIMKILNEFQELRFSELVKILRGRGLDYTDKTVKNRLLTLTKNGYIKNLGSSWMLTEDGRTLVNYETIFDRIGSFIETLEYNQINSTFDLYSLNGTVPTSIAIIDKSKVDSVLRVLSEVLNSKISVTNLAVVFDEGEVIDSTEIKEGCVGIGTISSTIYDIIMSHIGVHLSAEYGGLLAVSYTHLTLPTKA